jgi:26S proteasome regulatory subunit N2
MDLDQAPTTPKATEPDAMETDDAPKEETEEGKDTEKIAAEGQKKKAEREKVGYELDNLSRVLPAQLKYLTFPDPRYEPVKRVSSFPPATIISVLTQNQPTGGVVVVLDKQPEEPREVVELKASKEARQPPPPTETLQDRLQAAIGTAALQTPQRADARAALSAATGGAAAGAGVLTAVDEDEEGVEDAPVPDDFTYESDEE